MSERSQGGLSPKAAEAWEGIKELPAEERLKVTKQLLAELAAPAASVSPPTGEQMDSDLSTKVAASETVEKAAHGFSIVQDNAGNKAVRFSERRNDGTIVTYFLTAGAQVVFRHEVEQYGKDQLNGAQLRPHSELKEMVERHLNPAIKGLPVIDGVPQTNNEALKLALRLISFGVRTANGMAVIVVDKENESSGWAVSGVRVEDYVYRDVISFRGYVAFFGASSPESNN